MTADLLTQIDGDMILSGSTSKTAAAPCDYFYFPELKTVSGNLSLSYFDNLSNTGIIFPVLAAARKHHLRGPVQSQRIHTSGSRNPRRHIPRFMVRR